MVSSMYLGGDPMADSNLPDWMKTAIGNVGQIGPGAASYVSSSGPQDFSKLLDMYNRSIGNAPTMVDESRLKQVFQDQIAAAMQLGGEQINSAEGERGAAVRPGGVATQKMMDLGLKVQEPLVQALVSNLFGDVQNQNSRLASLFGAASGNQSNSLGYRNTTQDINSQLPPYVQQSNPGSNSNSTSFSSPGGSARPGGGSTPGGSVASGTPWWQTSYGSQGSSNSKEMNEWNDKQPKNLPPLDQANSQAGNYGDFWNQPGYPEGPQDPNKSNPYDLSTGHWSSPFWNDPGYYTPEYQSKIKPGTAGVTWIPNQGSDQ